jgi:multimeric flavodoxin WrbA
MGGKNDTIRALAITGGPRSRGNTYRITKMVGDALERPGDVEPEYLFLRETDLKPCPGCRLCMDRMRSTVR